MAKQLAKAYGFGDRLGIFILVPEIDLLLNLSEDPYEWLDEKGIRMVNSMSQL